MIHSWIVQYALGKRDKIPSYYRSVVKYLPVPTSGSPLRRFRNARRRKK